MTFKIFLAKHAERDLDDLPEKIHKQIVCDIQTLATHPFPDGKRIKKLKGFKEKLYRLRAGDYRIIFTHGKQSIFIIRIIAKKDFRKVYG